MRKIGQVLVAVVLWGAFGCLIYFVNPDVLKPVWYTPFWISVWCATTWTMAMTFGRMRGVLYATAITIFLLLRFFSIGNILTGFLLFGLVIVFDRYNATPRRRPMS